jgi:hypothetical protein
VYLFSLVAFVVYSNGCLAAKKAQWSFYISAVVNDFLHLSGLVRSRVHLSGLVRSPTNLHISPMDMNVSSPINM